MHGGMLADHGTVELDRIHANPLNPRKTFDQAGIEALSASIMTDGVLQPLVIRPRADDPDQYELIAGERRLRAMRHLVEAGAPGWDGNTEVPVQIRTDVDDLALLRMATAENVMRQDMHPMDEGEAYAALCDRGETPETIAAMIGLTTRHVQERIRVARDLAPVAAVAFREDKITLAQARAMSRGDASQQADIVDNIVNRSSWQGPMTADEVRRSLVNDTIPADRALFKRELYTGAVLEPEEGEKGPARFRDRALFERLQREEIERRRLELSQRFAWVEVIEQEYSPSFYTSGYEKVPGEQRKEAKANGTLGAIILVGRSSLQVDIQENVRKEIKAGGGGSRSNKVTASDRPPDPVEQVGTGQMREAKRLKTWALQDAIVGLPSIAMRLACLSLILNEDRSPASATHIRSHTYVPAEHRVVSPGVQAELARFRKVLGEAHLSPITEKDPYLEIAGYAHTKERKRSAAELWSALKEMTDEELTSLFAVMVASRFRLPCDPTSSEEYGGLTLGDPMIAVDLADIAVIRMDRRGVLADEGYIGTLKQDQLRALAHKIGVPDPIDTAPKDGSIFGPKVAIAKAKASDIRAAIVKHATDTHPLHVPPELHFGTQIMLEERVRAAAKGKTPDHWAAVEAAASQEPPASGEAVAPPSAEPEQVAPVPEDPPPAKPKPAAVAVRPITKADKTTVFARGLAAFEAGEPIDNCPYSDPSWQFETWREGWKKGQAKPRTPAPAAKTAKPGKGKKAGKGEGANA